MLTDTSLFEKYEGSVFKFRYLLNKKCLSAIIEKYQVKQKVTNLLKLYVIRCFLYVIHFQRLTTQHLLHISVN